VQLPGEGNWLANLFQTVTYSQSSFGATAIDRGGVTDPAPESVYQRFSYAASGVGNRIAWLLPVSDGIYTLRLHFADNTSVGNRMFDINLQGVTALADYDIVASAGGTYVADVQEFSVTAAGGSGIELELVSKTNSGARISGIELVQVNSDGVANPTVDLQLSTDNGGSWTTIAAGLGVDRFGHGSFLTTAPTRRTTRTRPSPSPGRGPPTTSTTAT
jgi:hypothetical protein